MSKEKRANRELTLLLPHHAAKKPSRLQGGLVAHATVKRSMELCVSMRAGLR